MCARVGLQTFRLHMSFVSCKPRQSEPFQFCNRLIMWTTVTTCCVTKIGEEEVSGITRVLAGWKHASWFLLYNLFLFCQQFPEPQTNIKYSSSWPWGLEGWFRFTSNSFLLFFFKDRLFRSNEFEVPLPTFPALLSGGEGTKGNALRVCVLGLLIFRCIPLFSKKTPRSSPPKTSYKLVWIFAFNFYKASLLFNVSYFFIFF